jgi:hypothetical protein
MIEPEKFDCICEKDDRHFCVSDHAIDHMYSQNPPIDALTLCDMLMNRVPCNTRKGMPHRAKIGAKRVCSERKGKKFNIILEPTEINGMSCWIVSNLKPVGA